MRGLKYFHRRWYRGFTSDIRDFYRSLQEEAGSQGIIKVGVQMGLGLTFARPNSSLWGTIRADVKRGGLEVLVSTLNRRTNVLVLAMGLYLFIPFVLFLVVLTRLQIIPDPKRQPIPVIILGFVYAAIFLVLVYEVTIGIFPGARKLQRVLIQASDRVAKSLGAEPVGKVTLVTKYPQMNRLSVWEWRIWKKRAWQWLWRPWPEMVTEEEFLKQTV